MSVASVESLWLGRDGENTLEGSRSATQVFRAITNDRQDDHATILADPRLPKVGQPHPNDPTIFCVAVKPRNDSVDGRVWFVTVAYANSAFETFDNPLQDAAVITWNTETFQRPAIEDKDGNAIKNAAGDQYDPPVMRDDSRVTVNIQKNFAEIPSWTLTYADAVNEDQFVVDGVTIGVRVAKMQRVSISGVNERNFVNFRTLNLTLQLKTNQWDIRVLNAGYREWLLIDHFQIFNKDGTPISSPALLNPDGSVIADPVAGDANYLTFRVFTEKEFSGIIPV